MRPPVSVVVTSFNQREYLAEAVESVLAQEYRPLEIVVTDDGSADGSPGMIAGYARRYPDRVRPLLHDRKIGHPQNRNAGLGAARGAFAAILDGDDRFLPGKIEREMETLVRHPGAGIVFSNIRHIGPGGRFLGLWASRRPPEGWVLADVYGRNYPKSAVFRNEIFRMDLARSAGLYDESLPLYVDWDFRIRMAALAKTVYCPAPLAEYRIHPAGISRRRSAAFHLRTMVRIAGKNRPLLDGLAPREARRAERSLGRVLRRYRAIAAGEESPGSARAVRAWLSAAADGACDAELVLMAARATLPPAWHERFLAAARGVAAWRRRA